MKKIYIFAIILLATSLCSYSACLLENIEKNKSCTGAAAGINYSLDNDINSTSEGSDKEELKRMYQIPTISVPSSMKNGFPVINPNEGCPFGTCLQK